MKRVVIVIMILIVVCLNISYANAVNDCVRGGEDINWCKNELAR